MMRRPLLVLLLLVATPSPVLAYEPPDAPEALGADVDACPSGGACLGAAALPGFAPYDPHPLGLAAVMLFGEAGGPPVVLPGPGWVCGGVYPSGGLYEVECSPLPSMLGLFPECTDPYAAVGGTAVSTGNGIARVSCRQFSGGFASSQCTVSWVIQGGCTAVLRGFYTFPLRCAARVSGMTVGGVLYAICGH